MRKISRSIEEVKSIHKGANRHFFPSSYNSQHKPVDFWYYCGIWRMDRRTLEEFMGLCENVKDRKTGEMLLNKGLDYVHNFKPEKFTWEWIGKITKESLSEGERIMSALSSSLERERVKGEKKGREAVALQMLENGLAIGTICKCTGLTEKQVEALSLKKVAM